MATVNKKFTNPFTLEQENLTTDNVEIVRSAETKQVILPENMSLPQAVHWLTEAWKDQERLVKVQELINGYPLDVAHALSVALKERFGFVAMKEQMKESFFYAVPIDASGNTVDVYLGEFNFPGLSEESTVSTAPDWSRGIFIQGQVKKKELPLIKEIAKATREILATQSLFRGKAITVETKVDPMTRNEYLEPQFHSIGADTTDLILSRDTERMIRDSIITPLYRHRELADLGIGFKRGITLFGPYGVGKTLCANKIAMLCEQLGITFLYLRNVNLLTRAYPFVRQYGKAVIFAEDLDQLEDWDDLKTVLDAVDTKDAEVMVIFTTNHIENIPEAALRPGRLDHLIHIQPPDAEAAARLVLHYGGDEIDRMNFDPVAVGKAVQGYIPAIIAEVMKRAKLSALTAMPMELGGDNHLLPVLPTSLKIGTEAIQIAAKSIKQHAEMVNRQQVAEPSDLEKMSHIVGNYIARGVIKAVDHVGSDKLDLHFRKVTGVTDGRGLATDNE